MEIDDIAMSHQRYWTIRALPTKKSMATSKSFISPIPQREKYANAKRPRALKKKKEGEESALPSNSATMRRVRANELGIRLYLQSK